MEKKKNNRLLKLSVYALLLTIVGLSLVSGTYAKYVSTASGTDTAVVAKWDIKAGKKGNEVSITGNNSTVSFDLFDTINDTTNHEADADVVQGKIAPGTEGSFEFSIKNDSEVNARYGLNFQISNSNVPLEFSIDGVNYTSSLTNIAPSNDTKILMGKSTSVIVYWRWKFENGRDAEDTELGLTTPSVAVTTTLIVEQID